MSLGKKNQKILDTMIKWVEGKLTSEQADAELKRAGVKLPNKSVPK